MVFLFITPDCKIRVHVFFFLRERKTGDRRWTDRRIDLTNNALRKTIIRTYTHRQRGRDTDRQTGRPTNNFTEIQRGRQTNRQAKGRQNDLAGDRRKTNLHTDRQTDRQKDRQTDRQLDKQTDKRTASCR